jgi:anti-sigma factor RsiW
MISSDDPKLTAYALGELQGQECAAIEEALRADPAARAAVEQIRAMANRVAGALAHEATADQREESEAMPNNTLRSPASRAAIIHGSDPSKLDGGPLFDYANERPKILRFPQLYFLIGGVAAACVGLLVSLTRVKPPVETQYRVVYLNPPHSVPAQLPKAGGAEIDGTNPEAAAPKMNDPASEGGELSRQIARFPVTPEMFAANGHDVNGNSPFITTANAR